MAAAARGSGADAGRARGHDLRPAPAGRGGLTCSPASPSSRRRPRPFAGRVDALYFFLIGISTFFSILIATLLVVFAVRFRRRRAGELPPADPRLHRPRADLDGHSPDHLAGDLRVERGHLRGQPPRASGCMEVYVVGKRWMWKTQHLTGQREINELHVPVGVPVKLTMTSEDVIHSFFIPAFRIKQDAVPGRYTTVWFEATKAGEYHLFCAEYCGTKHSQMIGSIKVLEPAAFQTWLAGGATGSPAQEGEKLFQSLACITCHRADSQGRGPRLEGLVGRTVRLAGGATAVADAEYIRESILNPTAKVVEGYQPIMPTFQGLVSEEGVMQLIAYIQSLQRRARRAVGPARAAPSRRAAPRRRRARHDEPRPDTRAPRRRPAAGAGARQLPHRQLRHQVVAPDRRPQAHRAPVHVQHQHHVRDRGHLRDPHPAGADHAARRHGAVGDLQQALHHARRGDGLLLPHPLHSRHARAISSSRS